MLFYVLVKFCLHPYITECPSTLSPGLKSLPSFVTCHMTSSCTSINCCMDVTRLKPQSLQFYLSIDSCQWTIQYGIDGYVVQPTTMYDFKFNEWQDYWMKGIYRLRYKENEGNNNFFYN